jgi:hypothetical protein
VVIIDGQQVSLARVYMTDQAAEDYRRTLAEASLDVFLTSGTDVESHFLSADHILTIAPDIDRETAERVLREATEESRSNSVERCINHWLAEAQRSRNKGGPEPNAGKISADANKAYDENPTRFRYGKRVRGVVAAKLQVILGRNVELAQVSPALSVEQLQVIARGLVATGEEPAG